MFHISNPSSDCVRAKAKISIRIAIFISRTDLVMPIKSRWRLPFCSSRVSGRYWQFPPLLSLLSIYIVLRKLIKFNATLSMFAETIFCFVKLSTWFWIPCNSCARGREIAMSWWNLFLFRGTKNCCFSKRAYLCWT